MIKTYNQKSSRFALLLSYSGWDRKEDGESPLNSSTDVDSFELFLKSDKGGTWESTEIKKLKDRKLSELRQTLLQIKNSYEFLFVVYSGHGCFDLEKNCHRFEINKNKEDDIFEDNLYNLADKIIFIYDSCSVNYSPRLNESFKRLNENLTNKKNQQIRDEYINWYKSCPNQKLKFYASKIGTAAYDRQDGKGGEYSYELLNALNNSSGRTNIVEAHNIAKKNLVKKSIQEPVEDIPLDITNYLPGAMGNNL